MTHPVLLYAEDFPMDADLLRHNLANAGLVNPLHITETIEDTLNYLFGDTEPAPAIVFLDLNLRGADGVEVLRRMREHNRTHLIPVIVLTISDDQETRLRAEKFGADAYCSKPLTIEKFIAAVRLLKINWAIL